MSRSTNHLGYLETVQTSNNDVPNEFRNLTQNENDTVINLLNSSNLNLLINEAVNQNFNPQQNNNEQQQQQQQQPQQGNFQENNNQSFAHIVIRSLQTSFPFVIIGLIKLLHQHFFGFLVVIGFLTSQHYTNKVLVAEIQLKEKKNNPKLMLVIGYLIAHVLFFFGIFRENNLENCLVFLSPNIKKMDTWNLIWIVVCTDTIIKFLIICTKALFTIFSQSLVSIHIRGNVYSTIEAFGMFYRCLIPIHPWILFLFYFEDSDSSPKTLPLFLCIFYLIFKLNQIYNSSSELIKSVRDLISNTPYGTTSILNDTDDNVCPICQDKLKNPISLKCQHTFCQDCVCIWLDKENSCPMCRTKIFVNKPKFRDGSTSFSIQWF